MVNDDFVESPEFEAFLDMLGDLDKKDKVEMLNPKRLIEMQSVYKMLQDLILPNSPDAKFECSLGNFGTTAGITIVMDELEVKNKNLVAFLEHMKHATNFEIHPLLNGNISMSINFKDVVSRHYED